MSDLYNVTWWLLDLDDEVTDGCEEGHVGEPTTLPAFHDDMTLLGANRVAGTADLFDVPQPDRTVKRYRVWRGVPQGGTR